MKIQLTKRHFANKDHYALSIFFDGSFAHYFFSNLDSICYLSRIKQLDVDLSDLFSDFSLHSSIDVSSCLSDVEDICKTFNIRVIK